MLGSILSGWSKCPSSRGLIEKAASVRFSHLRNSTMMIADGILRHERVNISRGITLLESSAPNDMIEAESLIEYLRHHAKLKLYNNGFTLRIGISGPPGAGKSTFIESFGCKLIEKGHSVAVLTIDPSSIRSGGSILGDKTRMVNLSKLDSAFIRSSPSRTALGGVIISTSDSVSLCELSGFDVVIVETVGAGQSETYIDDVVDIVLLVLPPASGDDLQGIKKGIMEIADMVVINKADGDLMVSARKAKVEYSHAMHFQRLKSNCWVPTIHMVSSLEGTGFEHVMDDIDKAHASLIRGGDLQLKRRKQVQNLICRKLEHNLLNLAKTNDIVNDSMKVLVDRVESGEISSNRAVSELMTMLFHKK